MSSNEAKARKNIIDKGLQAVGWNDTDYTKQGIRSVFGPPEIDEILIFTKKLIAA